VRDGLGIGRGLGGGRSIELHDSIDISAKSACAKVPSRTFAHGAYLLAPSPESKRHAARKCTFQARRPRLWLSTAQESRMTQGHEQSACKFQAYVRSLEASSHQDMDILERAESEDFVEPVRVVFQPVL
jgi:hypothetical protein